MDSSTEQTNNYQPTSDPKLTTEKRSAECSTNLAEQKDHLLSSQLSFNMSLSHNELIKFFKKSIKELIEIDPLLKDLRPDITFDEVESMLALENGRAVTVYIERDEFKPWRVVVPKDASIHQLKLALKRTVATELKRKKKVRKVSWNYIWRTYWLCLEGQKLSDDNRKLTDYGIKNKTRLTFLKKKIKDITER